VDATVRRLVLTCICRFDLGAIIAWHRGNLLGTCFNGGLLILSVRSGAKSGIHFHLGASENTGREDFNLDDSIMPYSSFFMKRYGTLQLLLLAVCC
jgi:hypothetical protein